MMYTDKGRKELGVAERFYWCLEEFSRRLGKED